MTETIAMTEENVPDGEPNVSMSETERPPSGNGHADNESAALSNELLASGRGMLGVVARFEYGPVGEALNASRSGIRTALILGLVAGLNTLTVVLWTVLSRQIGVSLGVGSLARMPVATLVAAMSIAVPVLSLPRADLRRQRVTLGSAFATSSLLCLAVAGTFWGLLVAAVLAGAGLAVTHAVHFELMLDTYRPEVRVRMFSVYGCVLLACTAAGLLVLSLSGTAHGISWRFALLVLAACGAALTCLSPLVANPEHGRWDRHRIEEMVHVANGGVGTRSTGLAKDSTGIAAGERIRRVLVIRSSREAFLGGSISGLLLVPIPMYSQILWRDRFNVHPSGMAPLLAILFLAGGLGPIWLYRRGEVAFRRSPAGVAKLAGWAGAVSGVALSAAGAGPSLGLTVFALAVATSGLAALLVGTLTLLIPVVDFEYRSQASLIHGVAAVSGAVVGTQIMSAVGARFGAQWPFVIIGLVVVCSSARVTKMGATLEADLDRIVSRAIDASELDVAISKGRKPALLDCRHIDFSYGQLQVLFDVNFSVDEGEMVALLGTNGAGKSTLLRAISGVGFVDRGTLHYRGSEVTYLPYDRRVKLGIVQIPGGRAVFGPLTVVENLRAFGFALGADRKVIEKGIEESLATFPRLAERRNQLASTLSGGEQQMLGLAKAIILKPRLLLIDELSLGLAPRIVGELLEMVRRINQSGTAVVLVEQSVNIALSLVDHAYFMEKGEIRFDGSASALLARPDLLRAVFLQGAAKGAL